MTQGIDSRFFELSTISQTVGHMFIRTRLSKYSISWIEFLDYKHKQDNIFVLINIFFFLFTNKKLVNIKNNYINM